MLRSAAVVAVATSSALLAGLGAQRLSAHPAPQGAPAAAVAKASDGHFWADAEVDGRTVRFLVDTGSSAVTLTGEDARRIGLDLRRLTYDRPVVTAAGREDAALVVLDHIAVDGARVEKIPALVMRRGLSTSLLGMSYLGRLSSFTGSRDRLVLTP